MNSAAHIKETEVQENPDQLQIEPFQLLKFTMV